MKNAVVLVVLAVVVAGCANTEQVKVARHVASDGVSSMDCDGTERYSDEQTVSYEGPHDLVGRMISGSDDRRGVVGLPSSGPYGSWSYGGGSYSGPVRVGSGSDRGLRFPDPDDHFVNVQVQGVAAKRFVGNGSSRRKK